MEPVQTLIDRASATMGSRYKVAQEIGESASFLGQIARGAKRISPGIAAKLAPIVGLDPRETACAALVDLEDDPTKRERLARLLGVQEWRKR